MTNDTGDGRWQIVKYLAVDGGPYDDSGSSEVMYGPFSRAECEQWLNRARCEVCGLFISALLYEPGQAVGSVFNIGSDLAGYYRWVKVG